MVPPQQGNLLVGIVNKTVRSSVRPKPGFGIGFGAVTFFAYTETHFFFLDFFLQKCFD